MLKRINLILALALFVMMLCGCGSDPAGVEKLYKAIENGDAKQVADFLEKETEISLENCKLAEEETGDCRMLGAALELWPVDEKICQALIDGGADLDSLNSEGASYLQMLIDIEAQTYSAEKTYLNLVKQLLKAGTNVNVQGKGAYKGTALDYLMQQSPVITHYYDEIYDTLIRYGAKVTEDTFQTCMKSSSRFMYAKQLLAQQKEGNSPELSDSLRALIEGQPDKKIISFINEGKYKKKEERNLILFSAAKGSPALMKTLQEKGFDMTTSTKEGLSLLDLASLYNDPSMIQYLIKEGGDLEESDDCGYEANEKDEEKLAAFQRITETASYTPLSLALACENKKNAEYLLKEGAKFQDSSWCIASLYGGKKSVDFLLEQNIRPNDYFIFQSFLYSSDDMVKYMLDKGVDYNVRFYGNTVLEELKETGNQERYNLMMEYLK